MPTAPRPTPCTQRHTPTATIVKHNAQGQPVYRYPARVLWRSARTITLAARFSMAPMTVGGLRLMPGDCFVETYYANRWYNIFGIYARETGRLRGWYANIGQPLSVAPPTIAYRDLALDLVVLPNGQQVVLDAEEFAALALPPQEQTRALAALARLQARFRRCWPSLA